MGPLYELAGPKSPFHWETIHEEAFAALKESLVSAPVLAYPNAQDMFILDTDASNTAIGAELLQLQDREKVTSYGSFTLNPAQRNYCTTKKETPCSTLVQQGISSLPVGKTIPCLY